jgi:peptidoglycan/xylan/chitin deacetylase (PgdA/CDA1 family)
MSDVLVLCYHAISERWPASLSVRPDDFAHQLELLARRGYRAATFTDAVTTKRAGRTVVVTFDDAYRSVLSTALPLLARWGFPATVFAPTSFVGTGRPMKWPGVDHWVGTDHEDELLGLSWDELKYLAEQGWEVGSHTCSHPKLPELDDARLAFELRESKRVCERELGLTCTSLAYPFGAVDDRVVAAATEAGYVAAADLPKQFRLNDPLRWPRVGVFHRDDNRRFLLKTAVGVRRLRGSGAWSALERLRSLN